MCGITGKMYFDDKSSVASTDIERMNAAIVHRGPDDSGVYISPDSRVGFGHLRLSIIDLSPLGHQPMSYMDRYWIVFNGEIYNFQEKRELLESFGYTFTSTSDTEVIMALYDKFGVKCLEHMRGMFSFALYDEQERTVFCARDRVGKKPFKYYVDDNVFMFASELKAILTQPEYTKKPDYLAIHHFLTLQYCPAPLTGFEGIEKLEAGHYLHIDLKTKKITKEKYWDLSYIKKLHLSKKEWKKKILSKLEESVRLRMIADVPVGAFLSGGIDSSAVVAMMSRLSTKPIKTFSIGFEEDVFNELPYAKQIAELYRTDHTEYVVKPDAISMLPKLVYHFEEPYADNSSLPTYYVSKMAREVVTVALNGDGGDENFAGYNRHSVFMLSFFMEKIYWFFKIFLPLARLLEKRSTFFYRLHIFLQTPRDVYSHRYVNYICFFTSRMKKRVYSEDFLKKFGHIDSFEVMTKYFDTAHAKDPLDQALYADFKTYLVDDLMVKSDIDTMSVGLEARSPFLDHEFLELFAQMPSNLKLKRFFNKKYILKKALEEILPKNILYRKKRGFAIPMEQWLRTDLKEYAYSLLLSEKAATRGLFKRESVQQLLDEHVNGKVNYSREIWAMMHLELWFITFFDQPGIEQ